jgi:hypothetical protein
MLGKRLTQLSRLSVALGVYPSAERVAAGLPTRAFRCVSLSYKVLRNQLSVLHVCEM